MPVSMSSAPAPSCSGSPSRASASRDFEQLERAGWRDTEHAREEHAVAHRASSASRSCSCGATTTEQRG
eukprot:5626786-Pyramimonas_sp.AAC.1